jgi:hypothetical protein
MPQLAMFDYSAYTHPATQFSGYFTNETGLEPISPRVLRLSLVSLKRQGQN